MADVVIQDSEVIEDVQVQGSDVELPVHRTLFVTNILYETHSIRSIPLSSADNCYLGRLSSWEGGIYQLTTGLFYIKQRS